MAFFSSANLVGGLRWVRNSFGVGVAVVAFSTVRCSVDPGANGDGDGVGDGDSPADRPKIDVLVVGSVGGGDGQGFGLDPLCGMGDCVPDDASSCDGLGGAGGVGGAFGGQGGGVIYDPGDLVGQGLGCQVRRVDDCDGDSCDFERSCAPSGASGEGEPCVSASDCTAGMACVGEGSSGVCRPYCCRGTQRSCQSGTFCDERSVPEAPEIFVPVCVPVDNCPLSDPFPCPVGQSCACQDDRACVVVRADGATACTKPGQGETGDPCTATRTAECAHGFVCAPSAGCMKLCDRGLATQSPELQEQECPNGGVCTPPPEFPDGLGVCVGTETDDDESQAAR